MYIIDVFHSANLTLHKVNSIQSIQKLDKKKLKTRNQDGSCPKIQGSKDKEIDLISKTFWGKRKKGIQKKILIDGPCESNINTVFENHFLKTDEQIEVVKEIVLPEVSLLNDSVMNNNYGDQTVFSRKEDSRKR